MAFPVKFAALAFSVFGLSAVPALADMDSDMAHHSYYFRGAAGLNQARDTNYNINAGEIDSQFDPGTVFSGAIGYDFGAYTAEIEIAHRSNDIDTQSLNHTQLPDNSGTAESTAIMINGYYETPTDSAWRPYVGAGIGYASVSMNDHQTGGTLLLDDSTQVFAYQAMAGLSYDVTDKLSAFAEYRFFATGSGSLHTATQTTSDLDYSNHAGLLGIKYSFK